MLENDFESDLENYLSEWIIIYSMVGVVFLILPETCGENQWLDKNISDRKKSGGWVTNNSGGRIRDWLPFDISASAQLQLWQKFWFLQQEQIQ